MTTLSDTLLILRGGPADGKQVQLRPGFDVPDAVLSPPVLGSGGRRFRYEHAETVTVGEADDCLHYYDFAGREDE